VEFGERFFDEISEVVGNFLYNSSSKLMKAIPAQNL